jgi:hypothetical protein
MTSLRIYLKSNEVTKDEFLKKLDEQVLSACSDIDRSC